MDDFISVFKSISIRSWALALVGSFFTGAGLYGLNVPNDELFTLIDVNDNARVLVWIGFLFSFPLFLDVARASLAIRQSRDE